MFDWKNKEVEESLRIILIEASRSEELRQALILDPKSILDKRFPGLFPDDVQVRFAEKESSIAIFELRKDLPPQFENGEEGVYNDPPLLLMCTYPTMIRIRTPLVAQTVSPNLLAGLIGLIAGFVLGVFVGRATTKS